MRETVDLEVGSCAALHGWSRVCPEEAQLPEPLSQQTENVDNPFVFDSAIIFAFRIFRICAPRGY
jgi:hypothetical protein